MMLQNPDMSEFIGIPGFCISREELYYEELYYEKVF